MKTGIGGIGEPTLKHTFKVYRNESIECYANPILESLSKYSDYTFNSANSTIKWEEITSQVDYGGTTYVHIRLEIIGDKNEE